MAPSRSNAVHATRRRHLLSHLSHLLTLLGLVVLTIATVAFVFKSGGPAQPAIDAPALVPTDTDRRIESLQQRLSSHPENVAGYVQLGGVLMQKARETGDASYYPRAEAVLLKALELDPDHASAMTALGAVYLASHQFERAAEWARGSLAVNPHIANTYGVLGDAQLELGQYEAAFDSYQAMVDFKPGLSSYARVSHARQLVGDVDGAIEAMQMALAAGSPGTEGIAWARVQLGDLYFESGRIDEAARHYEAALGDFSGYYLALARLGEARAAQGRYEEAIRLYERAVATVPHPAALAALGDLYAKTGDSATAGLRYDTVEFIGRLQALNQVIYNRELAVFYADHDLKVQEALELARKELEVRKDIYGYDALAWTLYKNGRFQEAAQAMREAMKLGTQDASLYYHAGMIFYRLGDLERASTYLQQALLINPHFSLLQADIARHTLNEIEGKLEPSRNSGQSAP